MLFIEDGKQKLTDAMWGHRLYEKSGRYAKNFKEYLVISKWLKFKQNNLTKICLNLNIFNEDFDEIFWICAKIQI